MPTPTQPLVLLPRLFRHALVIILLALTMPMAPPVQAAMLDDVSLRVEDRSAEARGAALRTALTQILVRLTGSTSPEALPGVEAMLAEPEAWLAQYGYDGQGEELRLQARFDVRAISNQLERSGAPVWGAGRPALLLWATRDRGDIYARDTEAGFIAALQQRAAARGLPLQLPLMDDADRARISAADVRGQFDQSLQAATLRYESPFAVTVVYYTTGRPSLRWRVLQGAAVLREGQLSAASEPELAAALADTLADHMAAQYAVQGGDARLARIQIAGITRLADWQAVHDFIASQAGVRDVALARLAADTAELRLDFAGGAGQLERLLLLHGQLSRCDTPVVAGSAAGEAGVLLTDEGPALRLCWRPR